MTGAADNPAEPDGLADLRRLSADAGQQILLVQGGGGNASLKHDGVLWIKASGTWLADAERQDIFVPLDLTGVRGDIAGGAETPGGTAVLGRSGRRPSIETALHALLPHRVVLHLHPVDVIAWSVRADGETALVEPLAGLNWRWIPYARPGRPLADIVASRLPVDDQPDAVLVLANHGVIVAGATVDQVARLTRTLLDRLALRARTLHPAFPGLHAVLQDAGDLWRLPREPVVQSLATDPRSLRLAGRGVLYPDHVVFLGATLPVARDCGPDGSFDAGAAAADIPYRVLPGLGVVVRRDISKGAEAMLECLAHLALRLPPHWRVNYLDPADVDALQNWDAEAYRRELADGIDATCRAEGWRDRHGPLG